MSPRLYCLPIAVLLLAAIPTDATAEDLARPNVLWIVAEDLCPDLGCYGNADVTTPHLDRFAREGCLYRNAFATSPVCSPSRSALITGMYQTSIGAHHHRSHRTDGYRLPEGVKILPELLRPAGYYCVQLRQFPADVDLHSGGKEDWNFTHPELVWDSHAWSDLKSHQPFYAQVNFGEAHRPYRSSGPAIDPEKVTTLPPYIADHPIARRDWADYLETLQTIDEKFGRVIDLLRADGLLDNTVVIFLGDNGREDFRGKSTAFLAGSHVPLLVRWPGKIAPGSENDGLVSLLDVHASTCAIAGVELPAGCAGLPLLVDSKQRREYLFTARDRIENAVDRVRTVQDGRYRYLRNFLPDRPHLMDRRYYDRTNPVRNLMRQMHADGKLTPGQAKVFAPQRPPEELYDLSTDPFELKNLAGSPDPAHQAALKNLREQLDAWLVETQDQGAQPEPPEAVNATVGRGRRRRGTGDGDGRGRGGNGGGQRRRSDQGGGRRPSPDR
ncbi:sulfatase family protein [Lignipirellula cremea]|uniref:Arylsulfatase n=1 Tax=Lignipirellula cremea TaxID=2528010 RepID=A0A518DN86_9BACT|nr:sulfatase [Lignipirellula cremea]QDU93300.1 Arylsulfatase [Lignipirellula cremea]